MNDAPAARDDAALLLARAQALARRSEEAPAGAAIELLEFRLGRESYAVETRHVGEVVPLTELAPVPCTPPFILGVVNVRGRITAVIDVPRFLELPARGLTDLHHVILVRNKERELGLLADVIVGVRQQPLDTLQPALPALGGARAGCFRGVTAGRLMVLELERLLADPALIVHEEVRP